MGRIGIVGLFAVVLAMGCGGDDAAGDGGVFDADPNAPDADPNAPDADPNAPDADPFAPDAAPCVVQKCRNQVTACLDCVDNDEDGFVDSEDPECLGPCDNTEGAALTIGVGGEVGEVCMVDCYFDNGNGPGNDDCRWDRRCDVLEPEPNCSYTESMLGTASCPDTQETDCLDFCLPITPNGCDCFGCCTHPLLGEGEFVWIGMMDAEDVGTCTLAGIANEVLCPPCTPVLDCLNDCGECELCFGMTELPPECNPDLRCPEGLQECGLPGDEPCPNGWYCITGCCQVIID